MEAETTRELRGCAVLAADGISGSVVDEKGVL